MKPKPLISTVALPSFSYIDKNIQTALTVTTDGDSIHGFSKHKDWDRNPDSFLN
jgi:hypothetical protein